ncbi:TPA: site-specific DNA-methyltransferase [bacterium]|nr:site-specific DNA-methyltransferase [bacterium]
MGVQTENKANQLDGKTWLKYSISIWSDIKKSKDELQLKHPAMFPIALASRLIECFTDQDDLLIFDPFAGVGSTLIASKELGKESIGIEISKEFVDIANNRLSQVLPFRGIAKSIIYEADSRETLKYVEPSSVDMVITSPPYWDILLQKRTADYKEQRDYGEAEGDLGKIGDYKEFLGELGKIFEQVYITLRQKKYCCVVVMDIRKKSKFYPFHSDISLLMEKIGFILDDIIIWDRRREYNNVRPLGYPSVFRVNKVHEFIMIFQKL